MAPLVLPAPAQMANCKRDIVHSLRPDTFGKRRGNGGSSDEVEERDTSLKHLSSLPDPASEKSSGHSDTSPGHSKTKPVPMAQAKAVSRPVKTAKATHRTAPQSTPKSAPHPKSSLNAAPKQSPKTSIHKKPLSTPIFKPSMPIPTRLSLPYPPSMSPPLRGHPPGKHSPSLSPPPPQKHSISSHTRAIAAGLGSAAAVGLLIGLFLLLRCYCRRGGSNKHSNRTRKQNKKDEEAHPKRKPDEARESRTGGGIEMVRPTQAQRRDFGSQFSPSLESQLQRDPSENQEAVRSEGEAEAGGQSRQQPLVPERTISYFSLPGPVVGVAETAAAFRTGDARVVYLAPSDDGEMGRVVSLGDSCVIEMLVRLMDDEERRGDGIFAQERREVDGVVVAVANLGTRVVEAEESVGEGRAEEWRSLHGGLGEWVEDPHQDGHELDSEDERDACSFKSTRGSIESSEPEGGKSGDEQMEGAGRDVGAAGGLEGVGSVGSASAGSKGGDSGYEDDADSDGGDSGDDGFSSLWSR